MTPTDTDHANMLLANQKIKSPNAAKSNNSTYDNRNSQAGKRVHRSRVKERRDRPQFFSSSFVKPFFANDSNMMPSLLSSPVSQNKFAKTGNNFFNKRK